MANIYPSLTEFKPEIIRLNVITDIKKQFEGEIEYRRQLTKKYKRACNTLDGLNNASTAISVLTGISGIGLLTTVVSVTICIALEGTAFVCGMFSIICNISCKKINKKIEKHEAIYTLASSKLNTINELVTKSLEDQVIDEVEFHLILAEKEKYEQMKKEIRSNFIPEKIDEAV